MTRGRGSSARPGVFGWIYAGRVRGSAPVSGRLVALLEYLPPVPPPEGLLARVENRIDAIERARSIAEARSERTHAGWRVLGATLTGALAGAAAIAALFLAGPAGVRHGGEPVPLAVLASADGARWLRAATISDGRYLRLDHAGPPVAADRSLELWLIAEGSGTPQSLGLLATAGPVTVLPLGSAIGAGDMLALSEEPAGGSPATGPTGPVLISAVVGAAG